MPRHGSMGFYNISTGFVVKDNHSLKPVMGKLEP